MAKLVFSYSHVDEGMRNELEKHLSPLKRMGRIEPWHDRRINPGDEFDAEIGQHFAEADIILLLISHDFIASNYCFEIEMQNSLDRHERGEAIVIPVILKSCAWKKLPFGKLLAATIDGKPIIKFSHIDDGFVEVVNAVSKALDKIESISSIPSSSVTSLIAPQSVSANSESRQASSFKPRSSNLGIKKEFSDRDRDMACKEGFEYVARFFENTLEELSTRNSELEADFRQRDLDSFESSVYLNGKRVCHCGIIRNSNSIGLGDICYSQSGISTNSCNDSMSIGDNGSMIGFKSLMGGMMGQSRGDLLTAEGMAEHFWDQFIRPLK